MSRSYGPGHARSLALWLAEDDWAPGKIGRSIRIGITKDADRELRFYIRGNPYVSGPKRLNG